MTKVFLYLANRSIRVGFLILAVIGLRFLFRKLPKGPQLLLWAVVALRLAVPFSPESPWSLLPSAEPFSSQATINTPLQGYPSILQAENEISVPAATEAPHVVTGAAPTTATQPQTGSSASPGALETPAASGLGDLDVFFRICTVVWLLGMAAMISYGLVSYLRLRKKLSVSLRQDGCIYICDEISSPFVLGLCRPRIYLPSSLSQAAKPYVLAHEQAHLRHGDAWWKLLGFLLLSVYWFHPLVWAAYALFCRDLEMACDERAVKGMDDRQRKDYACTLLLCAAPKGSFSVCPVAFSQNSIKARIRNLLQKKNARLWAGLLALIAALVVILCFATNPKSAKIPVTSVSSTFSETDALDAIILDADSNQILYSQNAGNSIETGDWCRLALAIAVVQAVSEPENTVVDIKSAPRTQPYTDGSPFRKEVLSGLTVQDHLYRMLLANEKDSTYALARSVFGNTASAVKKMNEVTMDICGTDPTFGDIYGEISGSFLITDLAKLINAMLAEPLLNKIWCASSYTVLATQELVYSTNALLVGNPTGYHGIAQDDRVTGGLTSVSGDYADMAVTAEYQGKRVLCILTGALRITHPYGDDPNSYSVVDYWGNYEETEKLLNIAFG